MKSGQVLAIFGLLIVLGLGLWSGVYYALLPSEAGAVSAFLSFPRTGKSGASEGELMDPLIAARGDVVPRVVRAMPTIPMPMRRYAVAFLGNQGDRRALPLLRAMLANRAELDALRSDALMSIGMIDVAEGRNLAAEHLRDGERVSATAHDVGAGNFFERRSQGLARRNVISKYFGL